MKIDRHKSSSLTLTSSVGLKPKPANFRPGRLLATKKTWIVDAFFSIGLLTKNYEAVFRQLHGDNLQSTPLQ